MFKDYERKTCLLIDMSVPTDNNTSIKEYNEISKHKDLEIEIVKMWHLKTTTIPIIVGALGKTKKMTDIHINKMPGSSSKQKIQKTELFIS